MDKQRKIRKINLETQSKASTRTITILKKAWSELPSDFTFGERSLFIEVAERLIRIANKTEDRTN